mgnify:CR=1 FL=1
MKNTKIAIALASALALGMPLAGCASSSASDSGSTTTAAASSSQSGDFDAASFYTGTWRASVETSGTSVYGTTSGSEPMTDVIFSEDGTCEIKPLEAHKDLLTTTGTWEGTDSEVTITTAEGKTITLTVKDDTSLTANPSDFGIDGFDTMTFVLY